MTAQPESGPSLEQRNERMRRVSSTGHLRRSTLRPPALPRKLAFQPTPANQGSNDGPRADERVAGACSTGLLGPSRSHTPDVGTAR